MVPSRSSLASRFCTVPRATFNDFAREAAEVRALSRKQPDEFSIDVIHAALPVLCIMPFSLA